VVEARPLEPLRARHLARGEGRSGLAVGLNPEVVPDRAPESLDVLDRPAPQRRVAVELEPALLPQPAHVGRQARALDLGGGGLPELLWRVCHPVKYSGSCELISVTSSP